MNSKHYNVNQLRIDLWNELKEKTNRITALPKKSENWDGINDLNTLLQNILSIEQYYSFPGSALVSQFIISLKKGEIKAVSNKVSEIVALFVSDNYRLHPELMEEFGENNFCQRLY